MSNAGPVTEDGPGGTSILVPAFGKSDSDIFSGLMELVKPSTYYRRLFGEHQKSMRGDLSLQLHDRNTFELHLAVMLVDAPLFDVSLNNDGSRNISKTDWSMLKVQLPWNFNPPDSSEGYCINIVTKNGLRTFLDSVEKLHNYAYLPEHVEFLLDKRPTKHKLSVKLGVVWFGMRL